MTNKEYVKQLNGKLAKTYHELTLYWMSKSRVTGKSDKMDQSNEFIANQAGHCAERLAYFSKLL